MFIRAAVELSRIRMRLGMKMKMGFRLGINMKRRVRLGRRTKMRHGMDLKKRKDNEIQIRLV